MCKTLGVFQVLNAQCTACNFVLVGRADAAARAAIVPAVARVAARKEALKERGVDVVFLKELGRKTQNKKSHKELALEFLIKGMKYVKLSKQRLEMIDAIVHVPGLEEGLTLPQIIDESKRILNMQGIVLSKFVFQLYNADVLVQRSGSNDGPLYSRKIVVSPQFGNIPSMEKAYLDRLRFLVISKFPGLSEREIAELMRL